MKETGSDDPEAVIKAGASARLRSAPPSPPVVFAAGRSVRWRDPSNAAEFFAAGQGRYKEKKLQRASTPGQSVLRRMPVPSEGGKIVMTQVRCATRDERSAARWLRRRLSARRRQVESHDRASAGRPRRCVQAQPAEPSFHRQIGIYGAELGNHLIRAATDLAVSLSQNRSKWLPTGSGPRVSTADHAWGDRARQDGGRIAFRRREA